MPKTGRRPIGPKVQTHLPPPLAARIDQLLAARPGATRAEVLRDVIAAGIDRIDTQEDAAA